MNIDDPFADFDAADDDRTQLKPMRPSPGGRRPDAERTHRRPAGEYVTPGVQASRVAGAPLPLLPGVNPLESAAASLLAVIGSLKTTLRHSDPNGLRRQIVQQLDTFESQAHGLGVTARQIKAASYVLCTTLDETVLNTPWGQDSVWASESLLAQFHGEVKGGERFFGLLRRSMEKPAENLHLLELMYVCLALGFEGRYRVMPDGRSGLDDERHYLYRTIREERGDLPRDLSPHWQAVQDARNPVMRHVPLWVAGALGGIALLCLYAGFSYRLSHTANPVMGELSTLSAIPSFAQREHQSLDIQPVAVQPPLLWLSDLLATEIANGFLEVVEDEREAKITTLSKDLFRSGKATLNSDYQTLLDNVAGALNQVAGTVLITGHTDNVPIFTLQYPSNWELSQARADAVAAALRNALDNPARVNAEGRADNEPIAANDTAQNRARNRRVEIIVRRGT